MITTFASPKLQSLYEPVQQFLHDHVYPNELRWLRTPFREVEQEIRALRPKAQATGAWNAALSEKEGGPGLQLTEFAQLSELLGTSPFGHLAFNCQAPVAHCRRTAGRHR